MTTEATTQTITLAVLIRRANGKRYLYVNDELVAILAPGQRVDPILRLAGWTKMKRIGWTQTAPHIHQMTVTNIVS